MMGNLAALSAWVLAIGAPLPLMAQTADDMTQDEFEQGDFDQGELDGFAELMTGLFQSEPLTAEQQSRLPAARAVVSIMMPDGFYGKLMGDMIDSSIRPMMAMFTQPEFILGSRLALEQDALAELSEAEKLELLGMLDPAHEDRVDAILNVMTGSMGTMFAELEPPMRDGLSKAYAVRFDERQLADISAFFATPTGNIYAKESMALLADPQVMQSIMGTLPSMMGSFGDIEASMTEAMLALPAERGYDDFDAAERARMADLLDVQEADLAEIVKPPKPLEGSDESAAD